MKVVLRVLKKNLYLRLLCRYWLLEPLETRYFTNFKHGQLKISLNATLAYTFTFVPPINFQQIQGNSDISWEAENFIPKFSVFSGHLWKQGASYAF